MKQEISPFEFATMVQSGRVLLVDVRSPSEFGALHVEQAVNLPLERVSPDTLRDLGASPDLPLVFICQSGMRGKTACDAARRGGFGHAVNLAGGTLACANAGLPVVRGTARMSIERQVRIAAGSLVVLGFLLGHFVHPYGFGLCAVIGAGLVFAGVTDTCGMALVLARMPWNQRAAS